MRCRWLNYGATEKTLQALFAWHYNAAMEAPKKPRGRPALPPDQKLIRGTGYYPQDVWDRIAQAGKPATIAHLRKLRVKQPAG